MFFLLFLLLLLVLPNKSATRAIVSFMWGVLIYWNYLSTRGCFRSASPCLPVRSPSHFHCLSPALSFVSFPPPPSPPLAGTAAHRIIFKWGAACFYCHSQHSFHASRRLVGGGGGWHCCRIQTASWCSFRYSSVQLNEMFCGSRCLSLNVPFPFLRARLCWRCEVCNNFLWAAYKQKSCFLIPVCVICLDSGPKTSEQRQKRVAVTVGVAEVEGGG